MPGAMPCGDASEQLRGCVRGAKRGAWACLKKSLRGCVRPLRQASPMCACCVLVVYASFIAVATWLAVELDESDALDMEFAAASIPLTCTVLTPERDAALLSARSAASQYLGDGVRISNIDPQTCHVLCSDREWSSRLPYYCYHSSVELDGENRAFLSDLAVNCTRDCVRTGSIDHRILTRVPNFAESWFQRQATTLANDGFSSTHNIQRS